MKKVLVFAAVAEVATGLALLAFPSFVGQLLLGEQLTGVAIPVARVAGIALVALGIACWPGPPLIGMLAYSTIVALYLANLGFAGSVAGCPFVASGRSARNPDGTFNLGICKREKRTRRQAKPTSNQICILAHENLIYRQTRCQRFANETPEPNANKRHRSSSVSSGFTGDSRERDPLITIDRDQFR
ncbi:MAG: hypothetical protein WBX35_25245 [Pseudolabrys sp.]